MRVHACLRAPTVVSFTPISIVFLPIKLQTRVIGESIYHMIGSVPMYLKNNFSVMIGMTRLCNHVMSIVPELFFVCRRTKISSGSHMIYF